MTIEPLPLDRTRHPATSLAGLLGVLPEGGRIIAASGAPAAPAAAVPAAEVLGAEVRVGDVTHDSRAAGPGVLFACRPGQRSDGHDYAPQAVAAGSPALLVERVLDVPVPQLQVPSVAAALGPVAAHVHGHPSDALTLVGVTGTNGKTTTTFLLDGALRAAGHRTGLIGTVRTRIGDDEVPGLRTTPEAPDLQRLLRRMVDAGVTAGAMEVSSHGLALGRVAGTRFVVSVFTNLTQDHLDFHRDLEDYFAAKASLFTPQFTALAVVNVDDPYGRRLAAAADLPVVRVAVRAADADVRAEDVHIGPSGSACTARIDGVPVSLRTRLPGDFNLANALAALVAAHAAGVDAQTAADGIAEVVGVPGRMERVDAGQDFSVLVDYAHTPDSVENVLHAARRLTEGRVIVVVGCGGDRDPAKRPLMGAAAATLADVAVLTSDNPRSEDPDAILEAMASAARGGAARVHVERDRAAAITEAVRIAAPGDVVVIAGKGHETYQEFAHGRVPFDDREVARAALEARRRAEQASSWSR